MQTFESQFPFPQCLQGYDFLRHWLPENPMHFDPSVMPVNFLFGICNE